MMFVPTFISGIRKSVVRIIANMMNAMSASMNGHMD